MGDRTWYFRGALIPDRRGDLLGTRCARNGPRLSCPARALCRCHHAGGRCAAGRCHPRLIRSLRTKESFMSSVALRLAAVVLCAAGSAAAATPPVRTVTAFVELDAAHYEAQLHQTAAGLKEAKKLFEEAGFEVQTLRVTTQPFMQYAA